MINQKEFYQNLKEFDKQEKRGTFYPMFLNMFEKGFEIEAFLFILSTWNFARFRYVMNEFDLKNFEKIVNKLKPYFDKFEGKSIETINFDEYEKEIKHIFSVLSKIKGIEFTGASKLMHLTVPDVFVMWDNNIRKALSLKSGNSDDYFNFLKKMQLEFKDIKRVGRKTLAKEIDEYNYVKFTSPASEKNRNKRRIRKRIRK